MDELNLKLSSRFMRNIAAKLLTRMIYKKIGYKIDIHLCELDVKVIDGEVCISTSMEAKMNSNEFMKVMKAIDSEN